MEDGAGGQFGYLPNRFVNTGLSRCYDTNMVEGGEFGRMGRLTILHYIMPLTSVLAECVNVMI